MKGSQATIAVDRFPSRFDNEQVRRSPIATHTACCTRLLYTRVAQEAFRLLAALITKARQLEREKPWLDLAIEAPRPPTTPPGTHLHAFQPPAQGRKVCEWRGLWASARLTFG